VAILFLVFDVETAFLYPWAVMFRKLSCAGDLTGMVCSGGVSYFGLVEMVVFLSVMVVALAYAWRKNAIGWG
jgi:NADH:ubiquinone oxidoreductase subunit 3 (subunit A)